MNTKDNTIHPGAEADLLPGELTDAELNGAAGGAIISSTTSRPRGSGGSQSANTLFQGVNAAVEQAYTVASNISSNLHSTADEIIKKVGG